MDWINEKVTCTICKEPFGDVPKVLPGCLHVFCLSCLHKLPISYAIQENKGKDRAGIIETGLNNLSFKENHFRESCSSTRSADSALAESLLDSVSSSSTSMKPPFLQRSMSLLERSHSLQRGPRQESDALIFSINCPKCDRTSSLPPCGVTGLRTDYLAMSLVNTYTALLALQSKLSNSTCDQCVEGVPAVSFCVNCMKLICEDHSKCHNLWEEFANHKVFPLSSLLCGENDLKRKDSAIFRYLRPSLHVGEFCCPRHLKETTDHQIKYFCTSCFDLMCGNCTISTHKVSEHSCDFITPEYISEKKKLTEESLDHLSTLFQDLDVLAGEIYSKTKTIAQHGDKAKRKINELFSEITSLLEARKKSLCDEIDDISKDPLTCLSDCNEKVNSLKDHVRECQNFVRGNLDCEGDLSLLTVADIISSHTKSIALNYEELLPKAEVVIPEVVVSSLRVNQLSEAISKYGGIHVLPSLPRLRDMRLSLPLNLFACGASSSKKITRSMAPVDVFSRNLQDSITGGYVYSPPLLSPTCPQSLDDLLSSPIVINLPKVAGIHIRTIENVFKPSGIRIDHRNSNIVVCVFGSHQMTTLNQSGMEIQSIGEEGDRNGQFLYPQCSTIDCHGRTLVVDSFYRIQVFDRTGKFLKSIGQKGKGRLQFNDPVAIAVGQSRKIYVLERHNQRIQVLNSNYTFHSFIGKAGRGECEFYLPNDMTVGDCGHLYVADTGNHRIQILSLEGSFMLAFGTKGSDPGKLCHPSHLCVSNDEIYVSEEGNHRISIFSMKGYFMQCFGQKGCGEKEFNRPSGIAVDQNRTLYVSDSKNNRIQIFK